MATSSEFGLFFRGTREGLGLSLREFCRRNGFDPANVSRLERGLSPPPKSERILVAYAKGLKLKPQSAAWERFMTLAKPPSAKPRRGHGHRNRVRAVHLEEWATTYDARSTLPQLVRRLIRATAEGLVRPVEAPTGEQVQRPGWDVIVEASGNDEFVPRGVSGWELGVEKEVKRKADEDFRKHKPSRKITFIFVTARKWQKKAEWVEGKTKLKGWNEVRVYDSASLEEWLECAPAVDVWLARQLGHPVDGLIDADEYWKNLKALAEPSLKPEVYLASRGEQLGQVKEWLGGPAGVRVIESLSPVEAVDFIVAANQRLELGETFAARALIVETRDAWRSLAGGDARLVLVTHPKLVLEAELVAEAVRNGHHVIVCANGPQDSRHESIKLPRVSTHDLQKALADQGVEREKAERLTRAAGGSIQVLKRHMARYPGTAHPEWSRPDHVREVVPFLLAGRWSNESEGDRLALEKLADAPYREVDIRAEQWAGCPDPMLTRAPSRWELLSRDDSWALISQALNDDDLRRFKEVAIAVLGEPDPACDLPSDKRWQANVLGKVRQHSGALRQGLAESLALLGARPPEYRGRSLDPKGMANSAVRSLLDDKDWKTWASLSSELPLLAEAAPDAFLSALGNDLSRKSPAVLKLFDSDASPLFGPSWHTGLLFALETLAWARNLLPWVSRLLARLDELAPMTKHGSSPRWTLQRVFMPWYAQTTAPVEERVKILGRIAKEYPKAGWRLLQGLWSRLHPLVLTNYRPAYQDWALQWTKDASGANRAFQEEACGHLVVELAGQDVSRLKDVMGVFEALPLTARTELLERMARMGLSGMTTEDRRVLADVIREKVDRHRRFAYTDWALRETVIEELDRIRKRLEPEDVVARNAWLFGDYWKVGLQLDRHGGGMANADKLVEQSRARALVEVRSEKKWSGVLSLAEAATNPDHVGWAAAVASHAGDDARVLPALLTDTRRGLADFAKGYVRGRWHCQGWEWVTKLAVNQWPDDQLVAFALALPSDPPAWDIVADRGEEIERQYWKQVGQFCNSKASSDISRACMMLTQVGRLFHAVSQLAIALSGEVPLDPSLILHVLERGRDALSDPDQLKWLWDMRYHVNLLIRELQKLVEARDSRVEENKVATLEWMYLALLDEPKILYTWLEQKPEFFVELLTRLYPRSDEPEAERLELSESDRALAAQVHRLLNSWHRVPGSRPDGSVDEETLRQWVKSVHILAEKEARRKPADQWIGNVFAYAPHETDGSWPCIPVRDAIEEFGSEALTGGFMVGIFNKRGPYSKALNEGGDKEHVFAKQYFDWAEAIMIEWPKTAASLRRVGECYEDDARREDAQAESR